MICSHNLIDFVFSCRLWHEGKLQCCNSDLFDEFVTSIYKARNSSGCKAQNSAVSRAMKLGNVGLFSTFRLLCAL